MSREHAGEARVYALAVELIRYSDSRLDRPQLVRFLDSFQTVAPLTIGELWAWPSMLKLALIENLRRIADEMLAARAARRAADACCDAASEGEAPPLPPAMHLAQVVQLLQRAREYGPRLAPVRSGLDEHLAAARMTAEEAIRSEHQREAAAQVSIANVITSLRLCAQLDWSSFVEEVSLVERVLQRDPAGVHPRMDFLSRDRYRQAIEELAERTGEAQVRVALRTAESARQAAEVEGPSARAAHVGHHLIGKGRRDLERDVAYRPGLAKAFRRSVFAHATGAYLGTIALLTAALVGAGVLYARVWHASEGRAARGGAAPAPAGEPGRHRRGAAPRRAARAASTAAAPRSRVGGPRGRADDRRRPDAPDQRGGRRGARRARRGARARQPRPPHSLRDPRRLQRRPRP